MKFYLPLICFVSLILYPVWAGEPAIAPGDNLRLDGLPEIPKSIAESASRYTEGRSAGLADWDPAKRTMLILTRFAQTAQIHTVAMPGGDRHQVTFLDEPVRWAAFEPSKGEFLCYARDTGGDEFFQLYRFDRETSESTLLTDGKKRNQGAVWAPSGRVLAYSRIDADENGAFSEIHIQDPRDPKSDRVVVKLSGGGWEVGDWAPDETKLACIEYFSATDANLWRIDAASGEKALLTPKKEGGKVAYLKPKFVRDGKSVLTATDAASEFLQLASITIADLKCHTLVGSIPWDVEDFELSGDGTKLAFTTNEDGASKLHLLDLGGGRELSLPVLPVGVISGLRWRGKTRELGFTLTTPRTPADAYLLDTESGKVERWTESETGGLNTASFPEPELIHWKSFDGRAISGLLNKPPSKFAGRRPVIVNIHGGPEGQSRPIYLARNNYFLNELGVAILYPNVRGSSGYGKTFLELDNGVKREDSYKDIESLLDHIATREDLDPKRVMITGGSYGGHMTLAIATRDSDRIACAVDVVGISNLRTFLERTQGYRRDLRRIEYGDERDPAVRQFLEDTAPLNHAEKIGKPLFIVQGLNDPRVPVSEAEQMVATVKKNGTPLWYLVANDEGHGFQKKANQDFQFYATIEFVREFLLK